MKKTPLRPRDLPAREVPLRLPDGDGREFDPPDFTYAPESALLEAAQRRSEERHSALLADAVARLPAELALYVRLRFYSEPERSAREIARLMGRPEREIYRFRRQVIALLKTALNNKAPAQNADLSVQEK